LSRSPLLRLFTGALWGVVAAGVVVGAASARVVWGGETEIAIPTAALRSGDAHAAAEHARRAAAWYAPGAPHVRVAYERLLALGAAAEGLGHADLALFAYRGVRTAAIETRWIVTPHADDLERANRAIARLAAAAPRAPGVRTEPPQKIEREQLEALARDEAPRVHWVILLVAGALAWALGGAIALRRAVGADGLTWRRATPGALVTLAGVVAWLLSIWRA
jgi:hypothetical protein